jgi:hypothetical protein
MTPHFPIYMDYGATTPVDPRVVDESEFQVLSAADVVRLRGELAALLATIPPGQLRELADEVLADVGYTPEEIARLRATEVI